MGLKSAVLEVELRIPLGDSLKAKRSVIRPILDGAHRRFGVSSAEVDRQGDWDEAVLAFSTVASSVSQVNDVLDSVDRFVWSFPEVDVVATERYWVDTA
ncbi:DUF503 domain-containing protein [Actinospongicola halichondriae]|uniref:DUF503 domain-containing protein n=1 Tax=Actinospongicola halichondriae TaxID=3236844 RepID=UPI003D3B8BD4